MDELPRDAKELLALARSAEEPPAGARERVQHAVALTLSAGVAASAGRAAASPGAQSTTLAARVPSMLSGKLVLIGGAIVLIGGGTLVLSRMTGPSRLDTAPAQVNASKAPGPVPEAARADQASHADLHQEPSAPSVALPARAPVTEEVTAAVRVAPAHKTEASPGDDTLRAEMTLLHDASGALDRGELEQARTLLNRHRARYANGQLREERQGLEVLARCMTSDAGYESGARAYLRSTPQGVLSARIRSACLAREKP